jgi:hypothetical protein
MFTTYIQKKVPVIRYSEERKKKVLTSLTPFFNSSPIMPLIFVINGSFHISIGLTPSPLIFLLDFIKVQIKVVIFL